MENPIFRAKDAVDNLSKTYSSQVDEIDKIVTLTAKTLGWNIDACFCDTNSKMEENWHTKWHNKSFPNSSQLTIDFTVSDSKITEICIHSLEGLESCGEVQSLIDMCRSQVCQLSKFFRHFQIYMEKHTNRVQFIKENELDTQFNKKSGSYRISFSRLARMDWMINFDTVMQAFIESYSVSFTPRGQELAREYNFPEELFEHGFVPDWDAQNCIRNLNQLSMLENETPTKRH